MNARGRVALKPLRLCVLLYCVYIVVLHTLVAGLLARIQYPGRPATGHLDTGFSRFPCVYKQMLRWLPTFQVATTCFLCSPPDLNFLDSYFIFTYMHNKPLPRSTAHLQLNILLLLLLLSSSSSPLCSVFILIFLRQTMSLGIAVLSLLYFSISTFRSICAVPNVAVLCSSLTSCFPGMLL